MKMKRKVGKILFGEKKRGGKEEGEGGVVVMRE